MLFSYKGRDNEIRKRIRVGNRQWLYKSDCKVVEDLSPFESGLVVVGKTEKGNKLKRNSYALYSAKKNKKKKN